MKKILIIIVLLFLVSCNKTEPTYSFEYIGFVGEVESAIQDSDGYIQIKFAKPFHYYSNPSSTFAEWRINTDTTVQSNAILLSHNQWRFLGNPKNVKQKNHGIETIFVDNFDVDISEWKGKTIYGYRTILWERVEQDDTLNQSFMMLLKMEKVLYL